MPRGAVAPEPLWADGYSGAGPGSGSGSGSGSGFGSGGRCAVPDAAEQAGVSQVTGSRPSNRKAGLAARWNGHGRVVAAGDRCSAGCPRAKPRMCCHSGVSVGSAPLAHGRVLRRAG